MVMALRFIFTGLLVKSTSALAPGPIGDTVRAFVAGTDLCRNKNSGHRRPNSEYRRSL